MLAQNARAVLRQNRGATERTIKLLSPILAGAPKSEQSKTEAARRGPLSA
jgi:hypothetical protein